MEATPKAKAIDEFILDLIGKDRVATIAANTCMTCDGPADSFRDDLSRKEYTISGMCQGCQDAFFGEGS